MPLPRLPLLRGDTSHDPVSGENLKKEPARGCLLFRIRPPLGILLPRWERRRDEPGEEGEASQNQKILSYGGVKKGYLGLSKFIPAGSLPIDHDTRDDEYDDNADAHDGEEAAEAESFPDLVSQCLCIA